MYIHTCTHTYSYMYLAQSAGVVEYIDCTSAEGHPTNEGLGYGTKRYDREAPVVLELWGMQSALSMPLLSSSLWPRVVAPDRALSMG